VSVGLAGENRLVTVVFADMSSSVSTTRSLDAEDAAVLVNQLLGEMVAATAEYGGRVDRFLGDGVLAVFGAVSVHEDDAERAILTALRIRAQARRLGLATTAGINTGEVYFGTVGSAVHQEVTVMGPPVNLAARLQGRAAPDDVLVGDATWRQTRGAFEFERSFVDIKGINEPVAAYRVLGARVFPEKRRGLEGLQSPLVGRDEQLRLLLADLTDAVSGHGRLVLITGEAGIGKTRLVGELQARHVLVHPVPRWLEGHCRELAMSVSYVPFVEVIGSLIGLSADDNAATATERVASALSLLVQGDHLGMERAVELRPLLGWLLAADASATPDNALLPSDPEQLKREAFHAVRDFLVAAGQREPLVMFLDDLQWADPLSVELIRFLLESMTNAPLLIICSFRLEPERPGATLITDASVHYPDRVRHLSLDDLTPPDVERMLEGLLGRTQLPTELKAWIVPQTRGIPFYVEELLRALIDRGVMRLERGAWTMTSAADETRVPETIQSLIRARLDLISLEGRGVLYDAAVLGLVFRTDALVLLRGELPPVQAALRELEDRALIQQGTLEGEWSFRHALVQETAYRSMLRPVRAVRHAKAGWALEELSAQRRDEPTQEIAHHYDLGEVADKAAGWLLRAGRRARRAYLTEQAVRDFRRGLEWLARIPAGDLAEAAQAQMAWELNEELGTTLDTMAHHSQARAAHEAALSSVPDAAPVARARLLRKIGITLGSEDRFDDAMLFYAEAISVLDQELCRDQAWWAEWLDVHIEQMWIHYQADRWEAMADLARRLQPAVERYGAAAQRVAFFRCLGAMVLRRNRYVVDDEAIGYTRRALAAAEASGDVVLLGHAWFALGTALLLHGDSVDAEENLRRALSIWERTGDVASQAACQTYLTVLARLAGDLDLVRQRAIEALKAATLANAVQYIGAAKANLAWTALREGREAEAKQLGTEALDCWAPLANAYGFKWQAIWPLLWLAVERDDLAEAKALADQLLAHSQQLPASDLRPLLKRVVGDSTDKSQIRDLLRQAAGMAKTIGYL
jgi:class 3 adenylate cyclase/tetratricopeptide (TPR) repeat protein